MKYIKWLVMLACMFSLPHLMADDTDIYLESNGARSNPPYLMLMVDFTADAGRKYCQSLSDCWPLFTENSFAKLCSLYAVPDGVDPKYTESACRLLYNQLKEKKTDGTNLTGQSVADY